MHFITPYTQIGYRCIQSHGCVCHLNHFPKKRRKNDLLCYYKLLNTKRFQYRIYNIAYSSATNLCNQIAKGLKNYIYKFNSTIILSYTVDKCSRYTQSSIQYSILFLYTRVCRVISQLNMTFQRRQNIFITIPSDLRASRKKGVVYILCLLTLQHRQ